MKNMKNKQKTQINKIVYEAIGKLAMGMWDEKPTGCSIWGVYEPEVPLEILLKNKDKK